ncbi:MAG: hypothetical protein LBJ67_06595 [Planctomycetaceae bacterium]|jgi:hypothetical protein|nr:hypothetical protein [Planctomycetaceae bacterium]
MNRKTIKFFFFITLLISCNNLYGQYRIGYSFKSADGFETVIVAGPYNYTDAVKYKNNRQAENLELLTVNGNCWLSQNSQPSKNSYPQLHSVQDLRGYWTVVDENGGYVTSGRAYKASGKFYNVGSKW